jgi:hypothetical protein
MRQIQLYPVSHHHDQRSPICTGPMLIDCTIDATATPVSPVSRHGKQAIQVSRESVNTATPSVGKRAKPRTASTADSDMAATAVPRERRTRQPAQRLSPVDDNCTPNPVDHAPSIAPRTRRQVQSTKTLGNAPSSSGHAEQQPSAVPLRRSGRERNPSFKVRGG